jgi:hypothetical protein
MRSLDAARSAPMLPPADASRLVAIVSVSLALSYAVFLLGSFAQGYFLIDRHGDGIANDFVNLWASGHLALKGNAAGAYDWKLQVQAQEAAVGHPFPADPVWPYPPVFLFAAAAIACIPFVPAAAAWLLLTALAYIAAIRNIVGNRSGVLLALGFPGALWNITAGQSGFLSTALMAGALGLMERRPVMAGCCLGLLTYKPQLGLLFPLVLAVGGRWRVIIAAATTALLLATASWLAFGTAAWDAFLHSLIIVNQRALVDGGDAGASWNKLQTVFGLVRVLGGSASFAWACQAAMAFGVATVLCALWRSRAPFDLKAAALAVGALMATPYLFIYDLVLLAVPTAFFLRFALLRGFVRSDLILLPAAAALVLSTSW